MLVFIGHLHLMVFLRNFQVQNLAYDLFSLCMFDCLVWFMFMVWMTAKTNHRCCEIAVCILARIDSCVLCRLWRNKLRLNLQSGSLFAVVLLLSIKQPFFVHKRKIRAKSKEKHIFFACNHVVRWEHSSIRKFYPINNKILDCALSIFEFPFFRQKIHDDLCEKTGLNAKWVNGSNLSVYAFQHKTQYVHILSKIFFKNKKNTESNQEQHFFHTLSE